MDLQEFEALAKKGKQIKMWFGENSKDKNPEKYYIIEPSHRIQDEFSSKKNDFVPCYEITILRGHSGGGFPRKEKIQIWSIHNAELVN